MKVIRRGRYSLQGNKTKFYNTGSGVSFCVKGGQTSIEIVSEKNAGFVHVIRDFDYENKEKILINNCKKIDISFNDNDPHFVDIIKTNEASDNYMIFSEISTTGELLEINEKNKKFIKVYGDSSVAGYGILAHEGEANYLTNDGVENFMFRCLYSLGVDYDIFAASGWGLTFSQFTDPKTIGIEKFRDKLCINSEEDFNGKTPDFLIISLGTNDMSYIVENRGNSKDLIGKFIESYEKFIKKEREKNPQLPILMVYASLKEEWVYALIEKTYKFLSEKYSNIHIIKLPGDNSAISNHSYVTYHKEMSVILRQKILSILS